ncbi:MAG: hypothetical protein ACE5DN_07820 [Flavobacteriales bacterium]
MSLIGNIRLQIANHVLRRKLAGRSREVAACNLEEAKSVGVLFNVDDERTYKTVKSYVNRLREEGIPKVMALGYVDQKNVPTYLPYRVYFDFFSRADINKLMIPSCPATENFLALQYDVLIDLSDDDCFPTQYLLALADARLKVGKQCPPKNRYYDLRMEIREVKTTGYLIEQVDHYLRMLNKNEQK